MAKLRSLSVDLWEEDWFLDLSESHKLFYLYLRSKCDHAGIWRVNKRQVQYILGGGKNISYDDFLKAINHDEISGETVNRIIPLDSHRWFIPQHIKDNFGTTYSAGNNYHNSMYKLLLANKVDLNIVPLDFSKVSKTQSIDFQANTQEGLGRSKEGANKDQGNGTAEADQEQGRAMPATRVLEKSQSPRKESSSLGKFENLFLPNDENADPPGPEKSEPPGENNEPEKQHLNGHAQHNGHTPVFKLRSLYEKSFDELQEQPALASVRPKTPDEFQHWKHFVDFVNENGYQDLFQAKFVTPKDWPKVVEQGFTEDLWSPVCKKILSSGINSTQNLFFRIPQFVESHKPKNGKINGHKSRSNVDTGNIDYSKME